MHKPVDSARAAGGVASGDATAGMRSRARWCRPQASGGSRRPRVAFRARRIAQHVSSSRTKDHRRTREITPHDLRDVGDAVRLARSCTITNVLTSRLTTPRLPIATRLHRDATVGSFARRNTATSMSAGFATLARSSSTVAWSTSTLLVGRTGWLTETEGCWSVSYGPVFRLYRLSQRRTAQAKTQELWTWRQSCPLPAGPTRRATSRRARPSAEGDHRVGGADDPHAVERRRRHYRGCGIKSAVLIGLDDCCEVCAPIPLCIPSREAGNNKD